MPIHDQGYRRYGGSRAESGRAWQVIARTGHGRLHGRKAAVHSFRTSTRRYGRRMYPSADCASFVEARASSAYESLY